jgi:hypothetical protein
MRNKTITVDLEAWTPSVLKNIADGIHTGEIYLYSAGRQTGKSVWNNLCAEIIDTENDWDSIIREYSLQWLPDSKPKSKSPYKFSRAKWWDAEFSDTDYLEVRKWCIEQFGPEPWPQDAWSRWYHKYHNRIFFRDHKDYVLFLLRWS